MRRIMLLRIFTITALMCCLLLEGSNTAWCNQSTAKRILVLHSYHQGYAWTDGLNLSIRDEFAHCGIDVELFVEYMDTKRINRKTMFPLLAPLYQLKYKNTTFDAIIACDNNALNFMTLYQHKIFHDSPVVFCGIADYTPDMLGGHDDFIGVIEQHDFNATIKLMLSLNPAAKNIAVIGDNTQTGKLLLKQLNSVKPAYNKRVSFIPLVGLPSDELVDAIQHLPPHSLVLLLSYLRDRNANSYPLYLAPRIVRSHSDVPIYTMWDEYVTPEVLGGLMISSHQQGVAAVALTTQILRHEKLDKYNGPVVGQSHYLFNYLELQRLGISRRQLPAGSEIINEPHTFYYHYSKAIWIIGLIFCWMLFSLIMLLHNNNRRRKAEQAMRLQKNFVEELIDAIAVPLYYRDTKGVYLGANQAGIDFFGFAADKHDLIGKTSYELFPKEVADQAKKSDKELLRSRGTHSYESVITDARGRQRNVLFNKAPFYDVAGNIAGVVGTMLDITELKQAQQLATRFGHILDSSLEEIYLVNAENMSLLRTTRGARQKLGYSQQQLQLMKISDILADTNAEEFKRLVQPLNQGQQETLTFISSHICQDGSSYPVEVRLQQTELDGETVYVLLAHDISERLKLEQLKNEMLSMISHEMRTPLTAMIGFTEFVIENDPEPKQRLECLQTVHKETLKLHELIDNLLNLQQFKANKFNPTLAQVSICPLLNEVAQLFSHASQLHQIHIECPENLPTINADRDQLLQVFKNLLSNAIKYSPDGGTITLSALEQQKLLYITVADQGIGINDADLQTIFDPFYRVDNSNSRRIGGTGLGLALVKEIIHAHHGQIWVESRPNCGSTFYISLPVSS